MRNEILIAFAFLLLAFVLIACTHPSPTSGDAICDLTAASRDDLADALIESGEGDVLVRATRLIRQIDAACGH